MLRAYYFRPIMYIHKPTMLLPIPIHRKFRLSPYLRNQLADHSLSAKLRQKFGDYGTFMIGNWFAPDSRIHEPNRGVWFWSLLQKNDFRVLLIDESLTSKCYPHCEENTLVTFRIAPSPHPYKRQGLSQGIRHDLLICTNQNCQVPIVNINDNDANNKHFRLWNHDLVSCLNVLHIASSLRENCQITERLKHDVSRQPRPREHTGNEKDLHPCHRPRNQ